MRQLQLDLPGSGGAFIRWLEIGKGPGSDESPVRVFLHGLGASSTYQFPEIAQHPDLSVENRRNLLVDLLGFGYSDRPHTFGYSLEEHAAAVAAVLDAERIEQAEIIGHSLGGSIALALTALRPELVGRLVIGEANLFAGRGQLSRRIADWSEAEFLAHGMKEYATLTASPEYTATLRTADPVAVHRSARGLLRGTDPELVEVLAAYQRPKAFLVGELSRPYEEEQDARAAGARVLTVPRSGHIMPLDNPDGFARAVARALADTEPE